VGTTEETVSHLLGAFRTSERMLAARTRDLRALEGWSEVTFAFHLGEFGRSDAGEQQSRMGFTGYVDGELAGLGGVAWMFDAIREADQWVVERVVVLNRNTTNYQEKVTELPAVNFAATDELAAQLPSMVEELLQLPAPSASD
jgi:hypothetical protein